jgi:flagellar protein FlaJ
MELEKKHIIGIGAAAVIVIFSLIFFLGAADRKLLYFMLGIAAVIAILPFATTIFLESKAEKENNEMFLEFARNLVESVKAGTPISKSILNVQNKNYGTLTIYIQKLANQISIGIPVRKALQTFSSDVNSKTVARAINIISEAEKAGGEIEKILESVAKSVAEIEKLKKERRAAISGLVVQGYIIFLVFIAIMLVLQFKILPMTSEFGTLSTETSIFGAGFSSAPTVDELSSPFLYLLIDQGLFAGLVIGKLAEGSIKAGVKHSLIMMALAFLLTTGVGAVFG